MNEKEMYLKINLTEENNEDKIKSILNSNNIDYQQFESPTHMFCWEQAYLRLQDLCSSNMEPEDEENFVKQHEIPLGNWFNTIGLFNDCKSSTLLYTQDYIIDNIDNISNNHDIVIGDCRGCGKGIYTSHEDNYNKGIYNCPHCGYENTLEELKYYGGC